MNTLEKIIYFLQKEMPEPKAFGWFHILWIILIILSVIFLSKKKTEKNLKVVLGVYGFTALILEVLKQIIWSFNYENGVVIWDYQWYAFPFQLCTTPIFISIICLFLKDNKVRDILLSYMAYITILGSIATVLMPDSCFVEDILINIHTMFLHCGSLVVSLYLFISKKVEIDIKHYIYAIIVFICFVFLADTLNIIVYNSGILHQETFNMFFISPYFESSLPVFDKIQSSTPYILFLLIYIVILSIGGFITYLIGSLIKRIKK